MSDPNKTLWHLIQDAKETLLKEGVENVAKEKPHILQMALAGLTIRSMNGNGHGKARKAAQVGIPTGFGAGLLAILLSILQAVSN